MQTNQAKKVNTSTGYKAEAINVRGGGQYVTVPQRIQEAHHAESWTPGYSILSTDFLEVNKVWLCRVVIDVAGKPFIGHASVNFGGKGADATNPLENAETSALGRALGFAGFGSIESIASAEEVIAARSRAEVYGERQAKPAAQQAADVVGGKVIQTSGTVNDVKAPPKATKQQKDAIIALFQQLQWDSPRKQAFAQKQGLNWDAMTWDEAEDAIAALQAQANGKQAAAV